MPRSANPADVTRRLFRSCSKLARCRDVVPLLRQANRPASISQQPRRGKRKAWDRGIAPAQVKCQLDPAPADFQIRREDNVGNTKNHFRYFAVLVLSICVIGPAARAADISSCQTIGTAGNYSLTKDLRVTAITTNSPNCLVINVSNVGIDMQGHKITGLGNGTGAGITDSSQVGGSVRSQIIIANGKIQGFGTGINLAQSGFITIAQMDVLQNKANGISFDGGAVARGRRGGCNCRR
jgi:hypothetical protein